MKQQTAQIAILAQALVGTVAHVTRDGHDPLVIEPGSDNALNLAPGDKVTIVIGSDDRWLERQKKANEAAQAKAAQRDDVDHGLTDLDKAARDDIAANPKAGADLSGDAGMTLAEGQAAAAADEPADPGTGAGAVTSTTGATTRRSTRGSSQG